MSVREHFGAPLRTVAVKLPAGIDPGRLVIGLLSLRIKVPQDNPALAHILVPPGLISANWWYLINNRETEQKFCPLFFYKLVVYKWMSLTFLQLVPCGKE